MKRICWITSECFTETDYNFELFQKLCENFEIDWYVLFGRKPYLPKSFFKKFKAIPNLHLHICEKKYRDRDIRTIPFYIKLFHEIYQGNPSLVYFNFAPNPLFSFISNFYDNKKTIFSAHDGKVQNDSSKHGFFRKLSYDLLYKHARYVNMFSKSQANLMKETYPHVKIHTMVLPLKNFGNVVENKPHDYIRFLSFGSIIYQKNQELLIEAANKLYDDGFRNFKVSINGSCSNWDFYQKKIRHPSVFEINPNFVSNDELLRLFSTSHYAVFPYRRVSQSGVLKVAFNYNIPVIVSNIGSFKEEVVEGVNGNFFETENLEALVSLMKQKITMNAEEYNEQLKKMRLYTESTYSNSRVADYYCELFNDFVR